MGAEGSACEINMEIWSNVSGRRKAKFIQRGYREVVRYEYFLVTIAV